MKKFFLLSFLPSNVDLGLLLLRVGFGVTMVVYHGWPKVTKFSSMFTTFADPVGVGPRASYLVAVGGEALAATLVVLGLFTRFAALWAAVVMGVAFFIVHERALSGPRSGEMAFLYCVAFLTLVFTGAGRYSVDAKIGGK
ncbi:MAG TPA: DoxX family protein [Candidatus Synoicihabitans sp.]|nr:DoxX family protein [Candidatus Synoicihabitans sp.]